MTTNNDHTHTRQDLIDLLLDILQSQAQGLSEFELLRELDKRAPEQFNASQRRDNLSLFQTHFFLFHHLYVLREQLLEQRVAKLEIGPLSVKLMAFTQTNENALDSLDELRDYYLQVENLQKTSGDDVEQLLNQFWRKLIRNDKREQALLVLGLSDPISWDEIRAQYRRLVMEHHPDRGGDVERLQAINAALECLKP